MWSVERRERIRGGRESGDTKRAMRPGRRHGSVERRGGETDDERKGSGGWRGGETEGGGGQGPSGYTVIGAASVVEMNVKGARAT